MISRSLPAQLLTLAVACGSTSQPLESPEPVQPTSGAASEDPALSYADVPDVVVPEDIVRFAVPVLGRPVQGPDDAWVTIVMFSEFQCPFCQRAQATLAQIRQRYGNRVRFVFRHNPLDFHQNALPAAKLAAEAFQQGGDELFWRLHDILFENQAALSEADLGRYAMQVGMDADGVRAALHSDRYNAMIRDDQALAERLGARGTPQFFINGRQLQGAQPFEHFEEVIDQELVIASRLLREGTAPTRLYSALLRNALQAQPDEPDPDLDDRDERPARRQPDPDAVYRIPLNRPLPQLGRDDAIVTIVEFADFECPFCGRVQPTLNQLRDQYGHDVRVVWMNNPLPFHRNAMAAAIAAHEAFDQQGNSGFWRMHEKLFENQRDITRENLERWARELQLNMRQFRAALDNEEHKALIEAQQNLAVSVGAAGTPSFFINGVNLRGAQPYVAFERIVDAQLANARRLVANGTPRNLVYAHVIADGATEQQFVGGEAEPIPERPDPVYNIPLPARPRTRGANHAPVVIQMFSDFQCPFCSRVEPTISSLMRRYGDRVRLVWRDYPLPFHQQASLAAQAAREVFAQGGNRKFWQMHDKIFEGQGELRTPQGARDALERWAREIGGVNMARFRQALDSETHKADVEADMDAVRQSGARIGTPSFFINGHLLQGAQPLEAFETVVRRELSEAGASTTPR